MKEVVLECDVVVMVPVKAKVLLTVEVKHRQSPFALVRNYFTRNNPKQPQGEVTEAELQSIKLPYDLDEFSDIEDYLRDGIELGTIKAEFKKTKVISGHSAVIANNSRIKD